MKCIKCGDVRVGQSYCRTCANKIGRENYRNNKQRYKDKAKKRDEALDKLINAYKSNPCLDCHNTYPPYVMDFDHINKDKKYNISYMRRHRMAFSKIEEEIAKCEVVCSNCHRVRSHRRQPVRYIKGAF